MDWDKILSKLSVPGLILVALGAVMCFGAGWLAGKLFKRHKEKAALWLKWAGLALAVLGSLDLLDILTLF